MSILQAQREVKMKDDVNKQKLGPWEYLIFDRLLNQPGVQCLLFNRLLEFNCQLVDLWKFQFCVIP